MGYGGRGMRKILIFAVIILGIFFLATCENGISIIDEIETEVKVANDKFLVIGSISPAKNALDINPGERITIEFDRDVDLNTLTEFNVVITNGVSDASWTYGYNSTTKTVYFYPDPYLDSEDEYTITILPGVKGTDGSDLQNEYSWSFHTGLYPAGSMIIGSNETYSTSSSVTLNFAVNDAVAQYRLADSEAAISGVGWTNVPGTTFPVAHTLSDGEGTNTVYAQFRDSESPENESNIEFDIIIQDTENPSLSPNINSSSTYTNYNYSTVSLTASDTTSGLFEMRFSNNNASWSSWQKYSSTKSSWNLTSLFGGTTAEGTKNVYVQVSDRAGNIVSNNDSIIYDITPPTGTFTIGSGNPSTSGTYVGIYFYITDNLSGVVQRQLYRYGTGWLPVETYNTYKTWYLPPKNGSKTVHSYFTDGAGNRTSGYLTDSVSLSETYSTLTRNDISNYGYDYYMTTSTISGNDPFTSSVMAPGSVYVYYTNSGRYGKFEVVSFVPLLIVNSFPLEIWYNVLTINLTTYNANGTTYMSKSNLQIRGTYSCDLDLGLQTSVNRDFWWAIDTSIARRLVPTNGAVFAKWK